VDLRIRDEKNAAAVCTGTTGYDAGCGFACGGLPRRTPEWKGHGWRLLTNEALEVLALKPGATPAEIKEAYRDLVKVWHPDRFGSDPRLRQKAEDKLTQINDAYRTLQSGGGAAEAEKGVGSRNRDASSGYSTGVGPMPRSSGARGGWGARYPGWIFGLVGVVLGSVAGYLLYQRGRAQTVVTTPASVQRAVGTGSSRAPAQGESFAVPKDRLAEQPDRNVSPKDVGGSDRTGSRSRSASAQYRVFPLSDAQRAQLESACSSQQELHGEAAYQACLKVQLDSITDASSAPDLSALNAVERGSIESACSGATRGRGSDGYNRCLNAQMAAWAAEPSRPELSSLSEADRSSIENACRNSKYRDGPSAYDRCLMRFIRQLAEAR
jgi:curved DNA-binding protein CbpA